MLCRRPQSLPDVEVGAGVPGIEALAACGERTVQLCPCVVASDLCAGISPQWTARPWHEAATVGMRHTAGVLLMQRDTFAGGYRCRRSEISNSWKMPAGFSLPKVCREGLAFHPRLSGVGLSPCGLRMPEEARGPPGLSTCFSVAHRRRRPILQPAAAGQPDDRSMPSRDAAAAAGRPGRFARLGLCCGARIGPVSLTVNICFRFVSLCRRPMFLAMAKRADWCFVSCGTRMAVARNTYSLRRGPIRCSLYDPLEARTLCAGGVPPLPRPQLLQGKCHTYVRDALCEAIVAISPPRVG